MTLVYAEPVVMESEYEEPGEPEAVLAEPPQDAETRANAPWEIAPEDVARFCAAERTAFEKIFRVLWKPAFRAAHRIALNREDAEEAAQEGFVRAFRSCRNFRGDEPAALAGWLLTIVRRVALDALRRKKVRPVPLMPESDDPTRAIEASETCDHVRGALRALDDADRAVITLFEIEAVPQKEIAELMHLSIDAVKQRLSRARRKFREAYTRLAAGTGWRGGAREGGEIHV